MKEKINSQSYTKRNQRRKGFVLVIESEPLMREALIDTLDLIGLSAICTNDSETGVLNYRRHHDYVDAVIMDWHPPQVEGLKTIKHLQSIDPTVKVLISSHYSDEELHPKLANNPSQSTLSTLRKPYDARALLTKLEQLIGTTRL